MELREAAYKTTELGLIPEDWSITPLSKVGSFSKGKGIKKDEVQTDGIPCVRYGELYTKYDNIITIFHSYISEEVAASSIQIREGDILFAGSGETREEIGKCAAMLYADRVYAGGDIVVLRPNNFDSTLLGYLLNAPIIAKQKSVKGQGDAVVHIYSSGLANVKIPVPPPAEQKAIATALSDVDTLITNLDKLIAKKKAIKQGAMQRLLKSPAQGGQRLPGFEGEWEEKLIGDFARVVAGGTPSTLIQEYWNGDIPWMNSGELNLKFVYDVENRITDSGLKFSSTQLVPANCVLIGLAGQGKTRGTAAINSIPLCTNQSIAAIIPNDSYVSLFLYYFMDLQYHELRKLSTGDGGRGGLNLTIIRNVSVPFPVNLDEQKAIATILFDMDKEIESLETKKSKYLRIKQGMMQELLTGKTRLI